MNIKYVLILSLGFFLGLLFQSCDNEDNTVAYTSASKDAQIYSFSIKAIAPISADSVLRAQDSIRFIQVNKTNFAIDQVSGVIYNPDSLPFGTILKKLAVTTTFNSSYSISSVDVFTPDSLKGYKWNTTDSLDFSKQPVKFTVTAASGDFQKTYNIDIRIHKIDPDMVLWTKMLDLPISGNSKTLLKANLFYAYVVNGNSASLYTSDKNSFGWQKQTLTGMPSTIQTHSLTLLNGVFYGVDSNGVSYKSLDGKSWTIQNNGQNLVSILGLLPLSTLADDALLLVVLEKDSKFYLGKSKDLSAVDIVPYISANTINNQLPDGFPLKQAAAYSNFTTENSKRMLILVGGADTKGKELSTTWLVKNTSEGIEASPFTKNTFSFGVGTSSFYYNNLLYVLAKSTFYTSNVWGELWTPVPTKQALDSSMSDRTGQTLIVDENNYMWIFGGVSKTGTYPKDVWRGRLNKLNPPKVEIPVN